MVCVLTKVLLSKLIYFLEVIWAEHFIDTGFEVHLDAMVFLVGLPQSVRRD